MNQISVFEYLFKALYLDLIFTVLLSLAFLRRLDIFSPKLVIPIGLCVFGLAFHETAYMGYLNNGTNILTVNFASPLPAPNQTP